jgi:hypothetical protein
MAVELAPDSRFRPDKKYANAVLACRMQRALDFRLGRAVRTHRIQRDYARHGVEQLAGFLDFEYFASFIVPALGASTMWHLLFMTIGALRQAMAFERVVGTPSRGAPLRMTSFWIWHGLIPLSWTIRPIRDQHLALGAARLVLILRLNDLQKLRLQVQTPVLG